MKKQIKKILKKIILDFFGIKKNSVYKIFCEKNFLRNKFRFLKITKHSYYFLFNPILTQTYSAEELKLLKKVSLDFLNTTYKSLPDNLKAICLRLIYDLKIENDMIVENFFLLAEETNNKKLRYWLTLSIDYIVFIRTLELPQNFFTRRKKLFEVICRENRIIPKTNIPHSKSLKKKICIVTYLLDNTIKNSVQRVLLMFTNNLNKDLFDISIVCLDSFYCKNDSIANFCSWGNSYKKRSSIEAMFKNDIQIFYCSSRSIKEKLQTGINFIYNINPDIILDISDEYSPISYLYSKKFTTVYSPLRRKITASFCTHYRTSVLSETQKQSHFFNDVMENIKLLDCSFPEYVMESSVIYKREDFNLSKTDFILVSVGILPDHDKAFYDVMFSILKSNTNFKWLLVGCNIPLILSENATELFENKQIINWGYENNLASLYKICDVFINPNKTGGSGGIAIAAQQKLPIVITNYSSDALRWIKEENCLQNYSEYEQEIFKLYNDKEYYNLQSKKFKSLVDDISDTPKNWNNFNNIISTLA